MNIIIFGTGIAGRAIYRKLKQQHQIIRFIDNNPILNNTKYDNINISSVNHIANIKFDKIAISGVWINEMKEQLLDLDIPENKIMIIEDNSLTFSTDSRVTTTDNIIRELVNIFKNESISYCIEGSSLLCLLRKQNLSDVPDVDILIKSQKDLQTIWDNINSNPILNKNTLTKIIYKEDRILTKKDQIDKIIITSKSDPTITEPTVIDINLAINIGEYYIMDYENNYYLYFNKEYVDGKNYFQYKDIELLIPYKAEEYVKLLYGATWNKPAKKWSFKDYGNLLSSNDLKKMLQKKKR